MRSVLVLALLLLSPIAARAETGKATTGKEAPPGYEETGKASFYGREFQGKQTASGEKFDKNKPTAAHPTLPLGSTVEVTNLETGKSTEVKINDRGPAEPGRAIDLSEKAAKDIGLTKQDGVAPVKIEKPDDEAKSGSSTAPVKNAEAAEKPRKKAAASNTRQTKKMQQAKPRPAAQ
jgi:rare lipoprotein A